jgi:hypothetical protein
MGIADAIQQGPPPKHTICSFGVVLEGLEPVDKEAMEQASEKIRNSVSGYSIPWLHKVLLQEGFKVGAETMRRHVMGNCCCEPK